MTAPARTPVLGKDGWLLRYAGAVVAGAVALGATAILRPYIGERLFTLCYAAVAVSGALGFGPGALATLLCLAGVNYFFIPPINSFAAAQPSDFLSLAVFLLVALFVSGLTSRLSQARVAAQGREEDAECLSTELAQQARELEDQAHELEAKGIEYDFACDDSARVHADPEKTQQILLNLLSNAIKFTDTGGSITLSCRSEDGIVQFEVRDTGCGIAPEKQGAIFEPFVQLDRTLKSGHEGVGLGLAISRDLALQMKGTLRVESVVGQGVHVRPFAPGR